jgi:hypothetical protein
MRMLRPTFALTLLATLASLPAPAAAQTAADSAAIRATALDYIQGWFTGDAERMERALHPELAKRIVSTDVESERIWLDDMGKSKLVAGTRAGFGKEIPESERRDEVEILDIFGNAASARVDAGPWIDYMHLAKWEGRWVIVNVLWERRPSAD